MRKVLSPVFGTLLSLLLLMTHPLGAAVTATLAVNDDQSLGSEDWGSSVWTMNNNAGTNTINFTLSAGAQTITLGSVSGGLSSIGLTGSTIFSYGSGAQPVVTALDGTGGNPGGSVTLSETHSLQFDNSGPQLALLGGVGSAVTLINSDFDGGAAGAVGGDAWVSVGSALSLGTGSALSLTGGTGGAVSLDGDGADAIDTANPALVQGGNGGQSAVTAGTLTLTNSSVNLTGGRGGGVGIGAANSGMGIYLSNPSSNLNVTGGTGGNAFVTAGAVSLSLSNLSVTGGTGGNINISSASGGYGIYSLGPMTVTAGNGGNASVAAASVTLVGSTLSVTGGTGGNLTITTNGGIGTAGFSGAEVTGGSGGNAGVSLGSLSLDGTSTLSVLGGTGGQSSLSVGTHYPSGSAFATIGSLNGSGTVTMGGNTATLQVASGNFGGTITGNEGLLVTGGVLALTGANTYTGGTTVSGSNSTLNIQNNGNIANNGLVLNGGTLQAGPYLMTFSENVTLTSSGGAIDSNGGNLLLTGLISGSGGLDVTNSAFTAWGVQMTNANTYSGGTTISNGGVLQPQNGQALGTGNVVVSGGLMFISEPVTIGGNYTQLSGGFLLLSPNSGGRLNILGAATLGGTLIVNSPNGLQFHVHDSVSYLLLEAGSVTGTFGTFTNSFSDNSVTLIYSPTELLLDMTGPSFVSLARTPNQVSVAGALDSLVGTSPNSALITALNEQSDSDLPGIYNQLSPDNLTPMFRMEYSLSQAEAGIVDRHLANLFSEFSSIDMAWNGEGPRFAGNLPASQEAQMGKGLQPDQWGVFTEGLGDFGTVTSDGNGTGYQYSTGGMLAGMDYRFSKEWAGGLMLGYTSGGSSQSTGTVNLTGGQLGLYGGWNKEGARLSALVAEGLNNYTTQRLGFGGTASGSTQGQMFTGQLRAGCDMGSDELMLEPFVSGQYTHVSINAFNESGSLAPLLYGAQGGDFLASDLGMGASWAWDLGGVRMTPSLSASWEHLFQGNLDSLNAGLAPTAYTTVSGPVLGSDLAVLAMAINAQFGRGLNAFASYQGKVGETNYTEQNLSGGVNFGF